MFLKFPQTKGQVRELVPPTNCILGKLNHLSSFRGMWSLIVISVSELHPDLVLPLPDLGGCGRPGGEVCVVGHQRQPRDQHREGPGLPRGRCVSPLLLHRWPRDPVLLSGPLAARAEAPSPDYAHHPGRVSEWSEDGLQHGLELPGDLGPGPGRVSADWRRDVCGDLRQVIEAGRVQPDGGGGPHQPRPAPPDLHSRPSQDPSQECCGPAPQSPDLQKDAAQRPVSVLHPGQLGRQPQVKLQHAVLDTEWRQHEQRLQRQVGAGGLRDGQPRLAEDQHQHLEDTKDWAEDGEEGGRPGRGREDGQHQVSEAEAWQDLRGGGDWGSRGCVQHHAGRGGGPGGGRGRGEAEAGGRPRGGHGPTDQVSLL